MIQEFSVENFFSIKEKQTISFEATKDTMSEDDLIVKVNNGKVRLLRLGIIYGANASGKTNILLALQDIWTKLIQKADSKDSPMEYSPFAMTPHLPTKLAIIFYIDNVKYDYKLEYNKDVILWEELKFNPNGSSSLFYSRKFVTKDKPTEVKFGEKSGVNAYYRRKFVDETFNNQTVLATYGSFMADIPEVAKLYNWIRDGVHEIQNDSVMSITKKILADNDEKKFYLEELHKADFNISSFDVVTKELPEEIKNLVEEKNDKLPSDFIDNITQDLEFTHHTNQGEFKLSGRKESQGTLQYYLLLHKNFLSARNNGGIIMVDEICRSLHHDLQVHFILNFLLGSTNSQMIFTTHNIMLLDEDFVRRDMVYLANKSKETAETEIYSVLDIGLHKNIKLMNAYRIGRLGAVPDFGSTSDFQKDIESNEQKSN